jgi:hypothetical protein
LRPTGWKAAYGGWGFAPLSTDSAPAGMPFEKSTLHSPQTFRDGRDDGVDVWNTGPAICNTVTAVTIVTLYLISNVRQIFRPEWVRLLS